MSAREEEERKRRESQTREASEGGAREKRQECDRAGPATLALHGFTTQQRPPNPHPSWFVKPCDPSFQNLYNPPSFSHITAISYRLITIIPSFSSS